MAVSVILNPNAHRQLGEEGLLVLWRDRGETGQREGLACILSVCPQPGCPCEVLYVDGFIVGGEGAVVRWSEDGVHLERAAGENAGRVTLEERMFATVEPESGDTRAHPDLADATDPELVEWLASEMDEELLEVLHRYRARAKGYPPEGPRRDVDLDAVEACHLAGVDELLAGTRADEYIVGDRRYWAALLLCPTPGCECDEARVVFFADPVGSDDPVGSVLLDLSGPSGFRVEEVAAECGPRELLDDLWARFAQRHDVGGFLRRRQAQLKEVGSALWHVVPEPARAGPKIGRNEACPCGSGRKYKLCCLGKRAEPPGRDPKAGSQR